MTLDYPTPPPVDPELAVIGAVLIAGQHALHSTTPTGLTTAHFRSPRHARIWDAILDVNTAGDPVDPITVARALGADLPRVGGPVGLHDALQACPSPLSAATYAQAVVTDATRRALWAAGTRITALAGPESTRDLLGALRDAQDAVADVVAGTHGTHGADLDTDLDTLITTIQTGDTPPLPTGIPPLDDLLNGGLRPGTLTVIGARPGVGKTVIGLQVAIHAARSGPAGVTTLEMTPQDLLMRAVSSLSGVDYMRLQTAPDPALTDPEWRAVANTTNQLRESGLTITHRGSANVDQIRADIRDVTRTRTTPLVWVVDYLQLLTPTDPKVIREQQIAAMTRALKRCALETGVPIVLLSQLSRDGEKTGRPPVLTDLRESGAIEQDADTVILLHRTDDQPTDMAVRVAKNRRGRCGGVVLRFDGSYQRVSVKKWSPVDVIGG